jgi:hypothetical protein
MSLWIEKLDDVWYDWTITHLYFSNTALIKKEESKPSKRFLSADLEIIIWNNNSYQNFSSDIDLKSQKFLTIFSPEKIFPYGVAIGNGYPPTPIAVFEEWQKMLNHFFLNPPTESAFYFYKNILEFLKKNHHLRNNNTRLHNTFLEEDAIFWQNKKKQDVLFFVDEPFLPEWRIVLYQEKNKKRIYGLGSNFFDFGSLWFIYQE